MSEGIIQSFTWYCDLATIGAKILQCTYHVGRLAPGGPAELCNLYTYDELLSVNGKDVSSMDLVDIVALIKSSGTSIHLVVQQPEDVDLIKRRQMVCIQRAESNISSTYIAFV